MELFWLCGGPLLRCGDFSAVALSGGVTNRREDLYGNSAGYKPPLPPALAREGWRLSLLFIVRDGGAWDVTRDGGQAGERAGAAHLPESRRFVSPPPALGLSASAADFRPPRAVPGCSRWSGVSAETGWPPSRPRSLHAHRWLAGGGGSGGRRRGVWEGVQEHGRPGGPTCVGPPKTSSAPELGRHDRSQEGQPPTPVTCPPQVSQSSGRGNAGLTGPEL